MYLWAFIAPPYFVEFSSRESWYCRRWFVGQGRNLYKDQGRNSVPSDRFAGRGLSNNPTVMPGYHEIGQRLAKAQYLPKITAIKQDLKAIDNDLNDSSKSEKCPDLKKRKEEDIAKLKKIYSDWFSTDVQVRIIFYASREPRIS